MDALLHFKKVKTVGWWQLGRGRTSLEALPPASVFINHSPFGPPQSAAFRTDKGDSEGLWETGGWGWPWSIAEPP